MSESKSSSSAVTWLGCLLVRMASRVSATGLMAEGWEIRKGPEARRVAARQVQVSYTMYLDFENGSVSLGGRMVLIV